MSGRTKFTTNFLIIVDSRYVEETIAQESLLVQGPRAQAAGRDAGPSIRLSPSAQAEVTSLSF